MLWFEEVLIFLGSFMGSRFLFGLLAALIFFRVNSVEVIPYLDHASCFKVINRLFEELEISNPVVIDAGAFDGAESKTMSLMWPNSTIHSFEPVTEIYGWLVDTVSTCSNVKTYNLALGDFVGKSSFFTSEEPSAPGIPSMSGSILAPKEQLFYSGTQFRGVVNVDVITLDEWGRQYNVDHVDAMWLDMQGYELPMLQASVEVLSTVKIICTEVEFVEAYEGQGIYKDVRAFLEQKGFELVATDFYENESKYWFGSAIFVRR